MITVRHLLDGKGRALFSIEPEDPVLEAIRMMADRHVGALLVMRGRSSPASSRSATTPAKSSCSAAPRRRHPSGRS